MLKLNFFLEKFKDRLVPSENWIEQEMKNAIKLHCGTGAGYEVSYKKPVFYIAAPNAVLRSEILMKKTVILGGLKDKFFPELHPEIRFVNKINR